MPPLLELQNEIHKIYCRTRYNSSDTKKLTIDERERLELIVFVDKGSTEFTTNLFKVLNEIAKNTNMSANQLIGLILGVSLIVSSNAAWQDWLIAKEKEHSDEVRIELSKQDTERLRIIKEETNRIPELKQSKIEIDNFKSNISRKLEPTDQILINSTPIIDGEYASQIIPPSKQSSKDVRLDGKYPINQVKFPNKYGGDYRFSVTNLSDDRTFFVDVSPDMLTAEQIAILKESSFGIKHISLSINAKEYRGQISNARMVSIEWPDQQ